MPDKNDKENKELRIWKFIEFSDAWRGLDTSRLDDLSSAWFRRRQKLQGKSKEYEDFMAQLKREHAIETGIVEKLYDLSRGVTETFIKQGFVQSYLSHGDTNIAEEKLMGYLNAQLEAVNFVFDVVKTDRELSVAFVKELHALVTANQEHAEGRDQFGNKTKIPLLKGKFKERENNPVLYDGTVILYCPPDHVAAEMDNLVRIYHDLNAEKVHPLIVSAWFHHAFTTIHPFQDGNGRVARLLSSLILVKYGLFPLTVLREESKAKYIDALEAADRGMVQPLVSYFAEAQRRNIEKALNLREVDASSLEEVAKAFAEKVQHRENQKIAFAENRDSIWAEFGIAIGELTPKLSQILPPQIKIRSTSVRFDEIDRDIAPSEYEHVWTDHVFLMGIAQQVEKYDYRFDHNMPVAAQNLIIEEKNSQEYSITFVFYYCGYEGNLIGVSGQLHGRLFDPTEREIHLNYDIIDMKPALFSLEEGLTTSKKKSIREFVVSILTVGLAEITNQL